MNASPPRASVRVRGRAGWGVPSFVLLVVLGALEALTINLWHPGRKGVAVEAIYAVVTGALILSVARRPMRVPRWGTAAVLLGGFALSMVIAQFVLQAYPSTGDEYGYNYVADTLMRGRLWNQAYPAPLRDVLASYYIGGHGDQRLSQYAPGWPVVLLPFKLIGLGQFANAAVGLVAAMFLFRALSLLAVPPGVRFGALLLGVACPFVLFNDASFYNHTLTAAALLGIVWLDLRDGKRPAALNRFGIGFGFSVLLTTRYETFLVAFLLFAIDGLLRRRARFVTWALPAAAGAAPATLLLLAYNWAITGSPFTTTLSWVSPGTGFGLHASGIDGEHSLQRGLAHTLVWLGTWQDFAGVLLLPLYAVALWRRVRTRTVRWFDLVWPALVVFFVFYPDDGGYQYGPRYWFFAHAVLPITVAAGLAVDGGAWRIGRFRLDPVRLAVVQLASFAGFSVGFAFFLHLQAETRLFPWRLAAEVEGPAMILVPELADRFYVPWQKLPYVMSGKDYTRNGVGALGPVVMGIDFGQQRTALLCTQVPDRAVYRIELQPVGPAGQLVPVCNGAHVPSVVASPP